MQYFHAYSIRKLNSWFCNLYCKLLCCFPHVSGRESRRESRQCVGSFKQKPLAKAMTSKRCSTGPSPLNQQNSGITEPTGVTQQTAALNNSAQGPEMTKNIESRCSMQSRNDIWSVCSLGTSQLALLVITQTNILSIRVLFLFISTLQTGQIRRAEHFFYPGV